MRVTGLVWVALCACAIAAAACDEEGADLAAPPELPEPVSAEAREGRRAIEVLSIGAAARFDPIEALRAQTVELPRYVGAGHELTYPDLRHPASGARRRLRAMMLAFVRAHAERGRGISSGTRGTCRATLASEALVSLACDSVHPDARGELRAEVDAAHYVIDGDGVRPFELGEAFVEGMDLAAPILARCRELLRDRANVPDDLEGPEPWRACAAERTAISLGAQTLRGRAVVGEQGGAIEVFVPYAELGDAILADGPLRHVVHGEHIERRTVELPVPDAAPPPARARSGMALSEVLPHAELAARFAALEPEQREHLVAGRVAPGAVRLFLSPRIDPSAAPRISEHLGATPEYALFFGAPIRVRPVRLGREEILRPVPATYAISRRTLPEGTLAMALEGDLDGHPSRVGEGSRFVWIALARDAGGWVASDAVRPHPRCVPDPDDFVRTLPASAAERALGDHVVAEVEARQGTAVLPAALFVSDVGPPENAFVSLFAMAPACRAGPPLLAVRVDAPIERVAVSREETASSVVLVATTRGESVRLSLYPLGAASPAFELDVEREHRVALGDTGALFTVDRGRGGFARVVRTAGGFEERRAQ